MKFNDYVIKYHLSDEEVSYIYRELLERGFYERDILKMLRRKIPFSDIKYAVEHDIIPIRLSIDEFVFLYEKYDMPVQTIEEWLDYGFPFGQIKKWADNGFTPQRANEWAELFVSPNDAKELETEYGYTPERFEKEMKNELKNY